MFGDLTNVILFVIAALFILAILYVAERSKRKK